MCTFISIRYFIVMVSFVTVTPAFSGPMAYKGASMTMGDVSDDAVLVTANRAFSTQDALGLTTAHLKSDDKKQIRQLYELTYTRLLKRLNGEHSQANLWLLMGVGGITGNDFVDTKLALTPGLLADYETTRLYASATSRLLSAEGLKHDNTAVRLGFSFYESDYEQIQPWFIVESQRTNGLSERIENTPMIRLIHKSYFVEAGYSDMQQARFNFMYIF